MLVSIIIPAYNREKMIVQTLQSMVNIDFPKEDFEIIVADNNSTDLTSSVVKDFIEKNKDHNIHYLLEKRQGVHYARNTAAKFSKGEYLYFTDDDMIAERNLLHPLLWLFSFDSKVATVTGLVLPKWEAEPPGWVLKHCLNRWLSLNNPEYDALISEKDCEIFSCHQMIKRDIFFKAGGYNPENTMGNWIGDGETGMNIKIKEMGYKFGFTSKSVINHIIPASRLTQKYLDKRYANQGNCDSYTYYRAVKPSKRKLLTGIIYKSYCMIKSYLNCFWLQINKSDYWRLSHSKYYYWQAMIKYDWKLFNDASWRDLVLKDNWLEE